jgi:hypothetical protein
MADLLVIRISENGVVVIGSGGTSVTGSDGVVVGVSDLTKEILALLQDQGETIAPHLTEAGSVV